MNYFLKEEYFKFDKWKDGPYSHSIDIITKSLNEYQKYYGLAKTEDTYEQIYKVVCSKKTDEKLKKLLPAIEKSTTYINQISTDKKLNGIATVLFIIQKNNQIQKEDIIVLFKQYSENKTKEFSRSYILECIDYLEKTNIIIKNIDENYEVSSKI